MWQAGTWGAEGPSFCQLAPAFAYLASIQGHLHTRPRLHMKDIGRSPEELHGGGRCLREGPRHPEMYIPRLQLQRVPAGQGEHFLDKYSTRITAFLPGAHPTWFFLIPPRCPEAGGHHPRGTTGRVIGDSRVTPLALPGSSAGIHISGPGMPCLDHLASAQTPPCWASFLRELAPVFTLKAPGECPDRMTAAAMTPSSVPASAWLLTSLIS